MQLDAYPIRHQFLKSWTATGTSQAPGPFQNCGMTTGRRTLARLRKSTTLSDDAKVLLAFADEFTARYENLDLTDTQILAVAGLPNGEIGDKEVCEFGERDRFSFARSVLARQSWTARAWPDIGAVEGGAAEWAGVDVRRVAHRSPRASQYDFTLGVPLAVERVDDPSS